jgi:capsular exopolysaccharide synthesis family protein
MAHSGDRIFEAVRRRTRWSGSASDPESVRFPRDTGDATLALFPGARLDSPQGGPPPQSTEIGLSDLLDFLRRRRRAIAVVIAVMLAIGVLYVATTPPEYSATAGLVIDTRKVEIFDTGDVSTEGTIPNSAFETELQILRSPRIANAVIEKLHLTDDPEFMQGSPEPFGRISDALSSWLSAAPPGTPEATSPTVDAVMANRRARNILARNLQVQRVGLSYAISVSYVAATPQHASDIANGITTAYLEDQVNRQVATARQLSKWLQDRIEELRAQGFEEDRQALEKSAFRATYDLFLQRYTEALQQESLPTTHALVIAPAEPPIRPSSPKIPLIMAGMLVVGTMLGLGLALARDLLDRGIRRRLQLESIARVPCLGVLPRFKVNRSARRARALELAKLAQEAGGRKFATRPQYAIARSAPFSQFAETLRGAKLAADSALASPAKALGVVSSVANEGKTTVAANLAELAASFERVLLIDGDFRNPTLSRTLVPNGSPGLAQVLAGTAQPEEVMWTDNVTALSFLPAGIDSRLPGSSELLASDAMKALLDQLRGKFDFIVLDLPPAMPVVDVRAAAPVLDGFLFVVEWGATTEGVVAHAIREGGLEGRLVGTVLNKVVMRRLQRFEGKTISRATRGYLQRYRHVA